jgi:hypothetical protein
MKSEVDIVRIRQLKFDFEGLEIRLEIVVEKGFSHIGEKPGRLLNERCRQIWDFEMLSWKLSCFNFAFTHGNILRQFLT